MPTLNESDAAQMRGIGRIHQPECQKLLRRGFGGLCPAGGRPDPACASAYQDGSRHVSCTCWCGHTAQPNVGNIALDGYIVR